jgi:hypothetical protein
MGRPRKVERRKYQRISTDQVISFAPVETRDLLGVSRNLSTVVAVGQVAWATEMDPITTDVGLEFIEIDPSAMQLLDDMTAPEASV